MNKVRILFKEKDVNILLFEKKKNVFFNNPNFHIILFRENDVDMP